MFTEKASNQIAKLHPKQFEVYRSKARFRTLVAGRRFGKTALAIEEVKRGAAVPKSLVYYVSPSYRQSKTIFWDAIKDSIPKHWIVKTNEVELTIRLVNGSIIALKGADNPDSLRGVGIKLVVLDEYQDFKPGVFSKSLRATLSDSGGRALFIGTPKGYGDDTFNDSFYNHFMRGMIPENIKYNRYRSWQFKTKDSPFIADSEIEAAKRDLSPAIYLQEYEADWINLSGKVYIFKRDRNVKNCPYNPDLPLHVGMDFNVSKECVGILQPQKNGELWLVDEIALLQSNTVEAMEEFDKRYFMHDKQKITFYPDASGDFRDNRRGETNLDIIREFGYVRIKHPKKNPNVIDRINCVNRMFVSAYGDTRLYFDPKCKEAITCFDQLMYKDGTDKVDESSGLDHMTDAIGYPTHYENPLKEVHMTGYRT